MWLTDITEHPTAEGELYCCSIKDCFSNRIVGSSIGDRMTADLAVSALRSAIARRQPHGTVVVHSDRGGQLRSRKFRATLQANGLTGSMGRVASAADNAAMESIHALLQKNVLNRRRRWPTRAELRYEAHRLERTHLQPTPPPTRPRPTHPPRARARLHPTALPQRRSRRGMISHNRSQPNVQQSP